MHARCSPPRSDDGGSDAAAGADGAIGADCRSSPPREQVAPAARAKPAAAPRRASRCEPSPCQVPGCSVLLKPGQARPYLLRFRLCGPHLAAHEVDMPAGASRFCHKVRPATSAAWLSAARILLCFALLLRLKEKRRLIFIC